jgi:hypothetical protein
LTPPPRESAGSSSATRDDEALFSDFNAWLKERRPPLPERKPAPPVGQGRGR